MRRDFILRALAALAAVAAPAAAGAEEAASPKRPNVLFIAVDDLNHWVRHLGRNRQAITPNIDRLAARGVTFTRAYCASPVCNPSRTALLSGKRSSTTGVYDNGIDYRPRVPIDITLPTHFRNHGYRVAGAGKIYHAGPGRREEWTEFHTRGAAGGGAGGGARAVERNGVGAIQWAQLEGGDDVVADYHVVSWCIEELAKKRDEPLFLACGIYRPHLPWNVPKKYFDMFPLDGIELPPVKDDDLDDVPPAGRRMARPEGDHAGIVAAGLWKNAVQAYLASIAFADAQIGRLLDGLDKSPIKDETIVVLWGDHGWHLGEKRHWRKFALWEEATRAPLLWVVPGVTKAGSVCERTVDFMSLYPTLSELCGLPVPAHVEGASIRALLADPKAEWKTPALTTHGFGNHAVRSEGWRYIRYADGGEELYDERADPYEWKNLAADPAHAAVKADLARFLPAVNVPEPPRAAGRAAKKAARKAAGAGEKKAARDPDERDERGAPDETDTPRGAAVSGDLEQWHKVTLTLDGPSARERDSDPNPFTDYRMTVTFTHASGAPSYRVPGYFAADGDAGETSADAGNRWRAHLAPDKAGEWRWEVSFRKGRGVALDDGLAGEPVAPVDGLSGRFVVEPTSKTGRDLRARGRLAYAGKHHLRFAGSGEYFLKAGPDAPETLLAYADFDGTATRKAPLKMWSAHVRDWRPGDPTWKGGKGKGLIGALNYLASEGLNAFSFLTYNAGGDGDNVWPFVERDDPLRYDCSKLDQWGVVFDHAQSLGLYLHFKMQEQENDSPRADAGGKSAATRRASGASTALDGGDLGPERKLYCRELIARFGHALALNWNIGEENRQTPEQQRDMIRYLHETDPYDHPIVIHTFPDQQDKVYGKLLGDQSLLAGASLQNDWSAAHRRTLRWVRASAEAGRPWVVANDEQGPAALGVPVDPGYAGHDGRAVDGKKRAYDLHDVRKRTLWGTLLAGGAGVEYYFGYELPQNDLVCEDFRSRDRSWDYCRHALAFFRDNRVPFQDMTNADALVGNPKNDDSRWCLARAGEVWVVYLPDGGTTDLDLAGASGVFSVRWFDPRAGGALLEGTVTSVRGGGKAAIGAPPRELSEDWVALIRR